MDMYEVLGAACALAGALLMIAKLTKSKKDDKIMAKIVSALKWAKSIFPSKNKKEKK